MKDWNETFMNIAYELSQHSTCCRKHVGAILVKDGRIVSTGYNGVAHGLKHCDEVFSKEDMLKPNFMDLHGKFSNKYEIHAEQNCLIFANKTQTKTEGCTMYTTLSPCSGCAKLIVASGIKRVVYDELYDRSSEGVELLQEMGVECLQLKDAKPIID
jgi:dCMP deaminase